MAAQSDSLREQIAETTVGEINGMSVGIGNIRRREFVGSDGSSREALSARISLWEGDDESVDLFADEGSVLDIGDQRWRVAEIAESRGDALGHVTFERRL